MDDLLDLNWSSGANGPPALQPQAAKAVAGASKTAPSTSAAGSFDFLAAPLRPASAASGRASPAVGVTSSFGARPSPAAPQLGTPALRTGSGSSTPSTGSARVPTSGHATSSLDDAFSGLLSIGDSGNMANGVANKNMTMAQRQKAMEEEKKRNEEKERAMWGDGDFWAKQSGATRSQAGPRPTSPIGVPVSSGSSRAKSPLSNGLDDLLKPSPTITRPVSSAGSRGAGVTAKAAPAASSTSTTSKMGSLWDNPDFLASTSAKPVQPNIGRDTSPSPRTAATTSPAVPADPFDFDALEAVAGPSSTSVTAISTSAGRGSGMRTPVSDFDFGENGDQGGVMDSDEDDLLGQLGKPVEAKRASANPPAANSQRSKTGSGSLTQRPTSPPPHVLGQIVEMGFSPAQARSALAKTSTGLDVQAALELLLNGGGQDRTAEPDTSQVAGRLAASAFSDDDDDRVEAAWREREAARERQRARRAGPSRDSVQPRKREDLRREQGAERNVQGSQADYDYQAQADKVLAQATEMGQNIMSKASSFWTAGKERAMKAYEEQKKAREAGAGRSRPPQDGRPRWMIDAEEAERGANGGPASSWRDDEGVRSPAEHFQDDDSPPRPKNASRLEAVGERRAEAKPRDDYMSSKDRADLLFSEEPAVYKPANRHRKPAGTAASSAARTPQNATPRSATPVPLKTRVLVEASASSIQAAATARSKGNEHFKLGRFSEAETAYTIAASHLPEAHLLLVPIWNNRATTRLKLGQSEGAASDCTATIDFIGLSYHPAKEAPLPSEYAEVKLGEALVKAVLKRAQAYEMGEKWQKALEDWERLMAMDSSLMGSAATSTRNIAAEGARRARKMLEPTPVGGPPSAPAPLARSAVKTAAPSGPARPANPDRSAAVGELRKAAAAQDAEDAQRMSLKDSVDGRIMAWKGGKETNLRALIASLDMVLWDEMMKAGGLKVGMHELITEKQVKIRYMKVIARLHPDKLNVDNTTVEQRMLANGAFSALSDAWQAFNNP